MGITIKFKCRDNDVLKWVKMSLFWAGSIIAIPMLAISVPLALISLFAEKYIKWLLYKTDVEEYVTGILRFLLRRYALVEKSKLQEEYRKVQKQMIEGDELGIHVLFIQGKIKKDLLESLFPEIAKEVEG